MITVNEYLIDKILPKGYFTKKGWLAQNAVGLVEQRYVIAATSAMR